MGTFLSIARNFIAILIKHTLPIISNNPKMIDQWTCLKRGNTKISLCSSGSSVLVCQRMGKHHELHTEWAGNSHGICGQKTWTVQIPALILLNSHGSRLSPRSRSPRGAMWFDSLVAKAHRKKQTTPQGDNDFVMLHDVEQMLLESNLEHMGMDQYLLIPFLGDEHPFTSYFDVHQGYKVLTHCHIGTVFAIIIQHIGCHEL